MSSKSNEDCYFYYYSTCVKGNDCPYRHCEAALGTETVCSAWSQGQCMRQNCKFRHINKQIDRSTIPCYWERQSSGCLKPHCVFMHCKTRNPINSAVEINKLILPVKSPVAAEGQASDTATEDINRDRREKSPNQNSRTIEVPPVVVSLNDGEESDGEDARSTVDTIKQSKPKGGGQSSLNNNCVNDDLGIKTLEQLKMEKIHRESEHFYKSVYDAPSLENVPLKLKSENPLYPRDIQDKKTVASEGQDAGFKNPLLGVSDLSEDKEPPTDLRSILQKRQMAQFSEQKTSISETNRRLISLKRSRSSASDSPSITVTLHKESQKGDSLNFQIKTLEEIRKEKREKSNESSEPVRNALPEINSATVKMHEEVEPMQREETKKTASLKLHVRRSSQECYSMKTILNRKSQIKYVKNLDDKEDMEDMPEVKRRNISQEDLKSEQADTSKENSLESSPKKSHHELSSHDGLKHLDRNIEDVQLFIQRHPLTRLRREENRNTVINNSTSCCKSNILAIGDASVLHYEKELKENSDNGKTSQHNSSDSRYVAAENLPGTEDFNNVQNHLIHKSDQMLTADEYELFNDDIELSSNNIDVHPGEDTEDILSKLDEIINS